jgi:hypothetical protein
MSEIKLQFANLSDRHFGVTPGLATAYAEAVTICLGRHHSSPQKVLLQDGAEDKQSIVEWHGPDKRTQDGWANKDDATEFGAYGLALAAVELTRGMVAVRRAETRTGVDYYLGGPEAPADDLEATFRLEVSGTDLRERKNPPVLDAVEQALARFIATIEELRREGATRALPAENIGRLYALRFALEQLRQNFEDFRNRVTECARADREA